MKKTWAIRKDAEGVSPVIATILMVAITVVLAAVLYVMVLGFGGDTTTTPTSSLTKSTVTSGVKLTFAPVSVDTQWDDVTILLSDGTDTVQWTPATANLDSAITTKEPLGTGTLGSLTVYCNVTDLAGNGYVNQGDYFTLVTSGTSFSTATTYTCTILYAPSAGEMCHATFQG
ncbi:MAG: type IV pilin N-terminal domain-containing protein [Thermoplasmata archaeon]|nr:type IV pilin N-terminal domain-containing protein [Thermoplasmata archaeon]